MKKVIILPFLLFFITFTTLCAAEKLPNWRDMNILSVNKQEPRTTFMTYSNRQDALSGVYEKSPYYILLNGVWKFYYAENDEQLPVNATDAAIDIADWHDIKVPTNWEMQGFGIPVYINHGYEFKPRNPNPPHLPDDNPVGIYRRTIHIPGEWSGRDIYLHIAGAKSGVYVYVNGQEVGYSEDSKNPAEFLINPYIQAGENDLAIKIYRWSTGSYLECQDFFRLSGIERDVFLWSQPKTAVHDFRVISTLDETCCKGMFHLEIDVKNTTHRENSANIEYELLDENGKIVTTGTSTVHINPTDKQTISFDATINDVQAWTSETPNLYKLLINTKTKDGAKETIPFNVGFRRFEIKESEHIINGRKQPLFFVNGQPIKLKGVNVHEISPTGGHYVTPEEMHISFRLMKLNNINSVRLSHYPQDRRFYEMCDEYGFYVYDEANIESHGMYYDLSKGGTLGNNPAWLENHLYRTRNMYERNKNYPSVAIFSLGNEAGNGYNFYQTYLWIKEREQKLMNRPICYERALWEWNTDMFVPQYPSAAWLEEIGQQGADRPVVPSEYAHAMGNSTGNLYGQWNAIYKYPHLQGGYIWEWMDHALLAHDDKGQPYWAYGGDFGEDEPSDGNFVADGIIGPDQQPHPAIAEVKYNHQDIGFKAIDLSKGEIEITNRFYFTSLSDYKVVYRIFANEKLVKESILKLENKPQESTIVSIPVSSLKPKAGIEYFVNFEVTTKKPQALVPAGHVIAYDQFKLPIAYTPKSYNNFKGPKLTLSQTEDRISITSPKVNFTFDKRKGVVTSYQVDGVEYFSDGFGIRPNFWRAPNDNDYGNGAPKRLQVWKQSGKELLVNSCEAKENPMNISLTVDYLLVAGNHFIMDYEVYPNGMVKVSTKFTPLDIEEVYVAKSEAELMATHTPQAKSDKVRKNVIEVPRIGIRFRLPEEYNQVQYFGRGPEENYIDRKMGTLVGLYRTTAEEMYVPYVRPQENGHRTDTRWLSLTNKNGKGLLIKADSLLEFNALRNSIEDFDSEESEAPYQWNNFSPEEIAGRNDADAKDLKPKHTHAKDIVYRDFVEVCVDWRQQGVGGYDSWGARPIEEATIYGNEEYEWRGWLVPVE